MDTNQNTDPQSAVSPRDRIREAILNAKPDIEPITVFGVAIDLCAPDLEGMLQYRNAENDDTVMARAIVGTCYVPGTTEKVFDEADVAELMRLKFSGDVKRLILKINKVLGMDEEVTKKVDEEAFPPTE